MPPPDDQRSTITPAFGEGGFEPYLRAIRAHPLLVVIVTLTALAGAGAWLLVRSPDYRAVSQVLVTPAPSDDVTYLGLPVIKDIPSDPTRAIQTAAAIVDSPSAVAVTAQHLGPGWTPGRVRAAVTVSPIGGSNVVGVQASANEASLAARIADTFVQTALAQRRATLSVQAAQLIARLEASSSVSPAQLTNLMAVTRGTDPTLSLLHLAPVPSASARKAAWRILTTTLFAGFVLGAGAALLSDIAIRRWRTRGAPATQP